MRNLLWLACVAFAAKGTHSHVDTALGLARLWPRRRRWRRVRSDGCTDGDARADAFANANSSADIFFGAAGTEDFGGGAVAVER